MVGLDDLQINYFYLTTEFSNINNPVARRINHI